MRRTCLAHGARIVLCASMILPARVGGAQAYPPPVAGTTNLVAKSSRDSGAVFSRRDLWLTGAAAVAAVALLPLDSRIAGSFRGAAPQGSQFLKGGAKLFNRIGGSGALLFGVSAYGVGRVVGAKGLAGVGLHTTEAIALSGAATALVKGIAGRERPSLAGTDADEFQFGRGFTSNALASFPSGHTTAAFAAAAVLTAEARHSTRFNPWIVGPLSYGAASLVGMARIYDDKHWASDVVIGAAIGTLSGLGVVRYAHAHPQNRVERWFGVAAPRVAPTLHGASLSWHFTTR